MLMVEVGFQFDLLNRKKGDFNSGSHLFTQTALVIYQQSFGQDEFLKNPYYQPFWNAKQLGCVENGLILDQKLSSFYVCDERDVAKQFPTSPSPVRALIHVHSHSKSRMLN